MLEKNFIPTSWAIGLSQDDEQSLGVLLHKDLMIASWSLEKLPTLLDMEKEEPCILWLSPESYACLQNLPSGSARHLELLPKVLLVPKETQMDELDQILDADIAEILTKPLNKRRLLSAVRKLVENQAIHHSVLCMTKEIMLERELLEHKNHILNFMVNFLTSVGGASSIASILQATKDNLNLLFNVYELSAVLWNVNDSSIMEGEIYLPYQPEHANFESTRQYLLNLADEYVTQPCQFNIVQITNLSDEKKMKKAQHRWSMPVTVGKDTLGVLLLTTDLEQNLGRDQTLALSSVIGHLGFSLQTMQCIKLMESRASMDALTQINNRRHFEDYLDSEMERFERYEQPLALLLFDLDHFKQINDTYGHQIGDVVLREVADITRKTIRKSDYCARYGGEEFAVILPHTRRDKAIQLAERLRQKIAGHSFAGKLQIKVTISTGIACLDQNTAMDKFALVKSADKALYMAKAMNRNCVMESSSSIKEIAL